jgi:hypothetical protein
VLCTVEVKEACGGRTPAAMELGHGGGGDGVFCLRREWARKEKEGVAQAAQGGCSSSRWTASRGAGAATARGAHAAAKLCSRSAL